MMIIKRSGLNLAAGCDWVLPTDKEESTAYITAHKDDLIVKYRAGHLDAIGSFKNRSKSRKKIYAGALIVCQVEQNAIVIEEIQEDLFWIVIIKDGVPNPSTDRVCSRQQALDLLQDAFAFNSTATVVGSIEHAKRKLADVIKEAKKQQLSKATLGRNNGFITGLIRKAMFIFLLVAIAASAYMYWTDLQRKKRDHQNFLTLQEKLVRDSLQKKAYRSEIEAKIASQAEELVRGYNIQDVTGAIFSLTRTSPLNIRGWQLTKIDCDFATVITCKASRISQSPFATADEAAIIPGGPTALKDLIQSQVTFNLPSPAITKTKVGMASNEDLLHLVSIPKIFQSVNISVNPAAKPVMVTVTPGENPARLGGSLDWQASIPYFLLKDIAKQLNVPGLKVSSIELMNLQSADVTVKITGQVIVP